MGQDNPIPSISVKIKVLQYMYRRILKERGGEMQNQGKQSGRPRAIAALIVGVVALVASAFIPFAGLLGIVGIVMAKRARKGAHRKLAMWCMIISILSILFMFFVLISPAYPHVLPFKLFTHSTTSAFTNTVN